MTGVEQSILTQLRTRRRRIKAHVAELEQQALSTYDAGYVAALEKEFLFVSDLVAELEAQQATRGARSWLTELFSGEREEQKGKQHA